MLLDGFLRCWHLKLQKSASGRRAHTNTRRHNAACLAPKPREAHQLSSRVYAQPHLPAGCPVPRQPRSSSSAGSCEFHPTPAPHSPGHRAALWPLQGVGRSCAHSLARALRVSQRRTRPLSGNQKPAPGGRTREGQHAASERGRDTNSSPPTPRWIRGRRNWKPRVGEAVSFFFFF